MKRFQDRVAVVTGGGAGIGLAAARRIAAEGGRVALLDWAADDLDRALSSLAADGFECLGVHGSVAEKADCDAVVALALERWGRLDVLVANAGVRHFGSVLDATDDEWERVVSVNLRGTAHSCAAAARGMRRGGRGGAMVLVSSVHAVAGRADMPIYDATKAALLSLSRTLAIELAGDRIRVNSLCPGFVVTDFHLRRAEAAGKSAEELRSRKSGLLGRPGEPAEIAAAIAFLASDDAAYVTGTNLMVDGGASA